MKCSVWMTFARTIQKVTEIRQTFRSPTKASKQSDSGMAGVISVSECEEWSPPLSMIAVSINQMVKGTSPTNADKNAMAYERIPILDLKKVIEILVPRQRSANNIKELLDHFI